MRPKHVKYAWLASVAKANDRKNLNGGKQALKLNSILIVEQSIRTIGQLNQIPACQLATQPAVTPVVGTAAGSPGYDGCGWKLVLRQN